MNKTFTVLFALTLLAFAPLAAQAAEGKIGVVDIGAVLAQSEAGQAARAKLEAFGKKKRATLEAKQKQLKQERKALQKNASIQSEAARKQAQKEFQQHVQTFQKTVRKTQMKVAKKKRELLQPLKADLYNVIQNYAKSHGYSVILDKRVAVYYQDGRDLTDEILKAFNAAEAG